jgi:hypothetical protein
MMQHWISLMVVAGAAGFLLHRGWQAVQAWRSPARGCASACGCLRSGKGVAATPAKTTGEIEEGEISCRS